MLVNLLNRPTCIHKMLCCSPLPFLGEEAFKAVPQAVLTGMVALGAYVVVVAVQASPDSPSNALHTTHMAYHSREAVT